MDSDFNIDKDIIKIVEILNRIIGNISFDQKSKSLTIDGKEPLIKENDFLIGQESLLDKICKKIIFLYTKPIVDKPLTTSGNIGDKLKRIFTKTTPTPFGIQIDQKDLPVDICNTNESVKALRDYYLNKLKILFYLTQLIQKNEYLQFYKTNETKFSKEQKKNISKKYEEWKKSISAIVQNIISDKYPNEKLNEIVNSFTTGDKTTLELCESLTQEICQDSQNVCVKNTNILSVSKPLTCNIKQKAPSPQPQQTELLEIEEPSEIKKRIISAKYKTPEDFFKTVFSYFEKPNALLNIPNEKDDSICIGIKEENYERFEPLLSGKVPNKKDRDELISLLTLANSLYVESDNSLLDINKVLLEKNAIKIIDIDFNNISDIQKWIDGVVGNTGDEKYEPQRLARQLSYDCGRAAKKPKFTKILGDNCNDDILTQSFIYSTRGDGNCLLHAFLMTISAAYRQASGELKQAIADQFRQILINKNKVRKNKSEIDELNRLSTFDTLNDKRAWLTDDTIKFISENFKINIFYFSYDTRQNLFDLKLSSSGESKQYVCIFYAGNHFSGVSMNVGLPKNSTDNFRILESPTNDTIIKKYKDKLSPF